MIDTQPVGAGREAATILEGSQHRMVRWTTALLMTAVVASLGASGCTSLTPLPGPPPYHVVLAPDYDPVIQHRLLVMPLVGLESDPVAATMITDTLLNELRTVGPFEVLFAAPGPCPACEPPPPLIPSESELETLIAQHQPDAFVFVTVTAYSPYPPQELGLSVRVVAPRTRQTLASIDTVRYADNDVPFSNGDYTFDHPANEMIVADAAFAASSPREFAQLVTKHIAHALALDPLPAARYEPGWTAWVPDWIIESGWLTPPGPDRSPGSCGHSPRSHAAPQSAW